MEVMLTERCAQLVDKAGLDELEALVVDFETAARRARSRSRIVSANLRLHDAINRCGRQSRGAARARARTLADPGAARRATASVPGASSTCSPSIAQLLRAIARKDARRAGEIARRHCEGARDELLALLPA